MIPAKIEDVFLQLTTNLSGVIIDVDAGKFAKKEFVISNSIYDSCPFLEGTLEAIPLNESFLLEGMVIASEDKEYNIDVELFKDKTVVHVLIHNRTSVYAYVDQLNQNRNDIFFIKRELAEKNIELENLRNIADKANEEKTRFLMLCEKSTPLLIACSHPSWRAFLLPPQPCASGRLLPLASLWF